jgi:Ca-activated chloride channel homolog
MSGIHFANPGYFYLFIPLVLLVAWYVYRHKMQYPTLQLSFIGGVKGKSTIKSNLRHILFVMRVFALGLLIVALARPQTTNKLRNVTTEGIDITIALDISGSMLAQDFRPDRMEAAKDLAIEFISGRPNDRIGLVVFSGESFTQCPLTTDHAVLVNLFRGVKSGMIEDGTAIGVGLANAVNRIKESDAVSKVIILLTDGVNNMGSIAPLTAAEIARTFGVRVYTIGIGTRGTAPYPVRTPFGIQLQDMPVDIDEATLTEIARMTGGSYFRATNNQKLREIYQEIDQMEKTRINVDEYSKRHDEYFLFLLFAAVLLMLEFILSKTMFRSIT